MSPATTATLPASVDAKRSSSTLPRATSTRLAPAAANWRAHAAPMPAEAPVMRTVRPRKGSADVRRPDDIARRYRAGADPSAGGQAAGRRALLRGDLGRRALLLDPRVDPRLEHRQRHRAGAEHDVVEA